MRNREFLRKDYKIREIKNKKRIHLFWQILKNYMAEKTGLEPASP